MTPEELLIVVPRAVSDKLRSDIADAAIVFEASTTADLETVVSCLSTSFNECILQYLIQRMGLPEQDACEAIVRAASISPLLLQLVPVDPFGEAAGNA